MDDLPSIKKLNKIQQLMREAFKSAPPLQKSQPINSDFIVFESKTSSDSIFDRLLAHNSSNNSSLNEQSINKSPKRKCSQTHKWSQLKDNMKQELENKRMQFWINKTINHKIENEEEFNELEDNEVIEEKSDKCLVEDKNEDIIEVQNESVCDESEDNSEEEDESEGNSEEEDESECDPQNDDYKSEDLNPFIDNEAQEEEDEECFGRELEFQDFDGSTPKNKLKNNDLDEQKSISDENEIKDIVSENEANLELFPEMNSYETEDKCNELLDESLLNTSINSLGESLTRKFATQKIALSPFNTQPKYKNHFNNDVSNSLPIDSTEKTDDFSSQTLLGLCSGYFQSNVQINDKEEDVSQTSDKEDEEEDNLTLSSIKRMGKAFNVDSDSSDCDEFDDQKVDHSQDSQEVPENTPSIKNNEVSDYEELITTEAEYSDNENDSEEEEQDIEKLRKGFIEDEAELSGSDASSDEEDNDDDYDDLQDDPNEELPSDTELKDQIGRFHNKNLLDEDKRQLLIMKEMLFEDGDLHEDGKIREKKFRWNFVEDENIINNFMNDDSEDEYCSEEDEQNIKTPVLRISEETISTKTFSLKSKHSLNSDVNGMKKGIMNSISSFVVRDERLKSIISKRTLNSNQSKKPTKRLKSSKKSVTSIFDLLRAA